tara:strand:+ start:2106 stop:2525 length:420 start_codon:yes stop_codon:yes gene_type:complete
MSLITEFTPAVLKTLRPEIAADLAELSKKHGIAFNIGNASYTGISATFKLEMTLVGEVEGKSVKEIQEQKNKAEFCLHAPRFGLKASDFGAIVSIYGDDFRLVGIKPNSPTNRYLGEKIKGRKVFVLPANAVESQLKAA